MYYSMEEAIIQPETLADQTDGQGGGKPEKSGGSKRKIFWQFLFAAVNIAVVVIIATVDFGGGAVTAPFRGVQKLIGQNWPFFAAALLLPLASIALDVLKYTVMIKSATKRAMPWTAYKVSQIGRYYDNITPFGAGSQPFAAHYLTRKKIESGQALAIVVTTFILQQLGFLLLGPFFLVKYSVSNMGDRLYRLFVILGWLGYAAYMLVPLLLVLMTVKPSIAASIADFFIKLLAKMKIVKKPDKLSARVRVSLDKYRRTAAYLVKNTAAALAVLAVSIIQAAIFFGIPYFACRVLGATAADTADLFSRIVIIYFAITLAPTPGNSIAAEFSFWAVFLAMLGGFAFWGMLIWRLTVFYLYLAQGLVIIVSRAINNSRRRAADNGLPK